MGVVNRQPVGIQVGNDVVTSGIVTFNVPGATLDENTGELIIPSGASGKLYSKTITLTDITNKFIMLPEPTGNKESTIMVIDGIPPLRYGEHFQIDNTDDAKLIWLAMGLDGFIEVNDKVLVTYFI